MMVALMDQGLSTFPWTVESEKYCPQQTKGHETIASKESRIFKCICQCNRNDNSIFFKLKSIPLIALGSGKEKRKYQWEKHKIK